MFTVIALIVGLVIGGIGGYALFRYVLTGKYKRMTAKANEEAEVIKEKKLLEVKEKFLNKKAELEKEVQLRNQKIAQAENKLKQREIGLNQRQEELSRRKAEIEKAQTRIDNQQQALTAREEELERLQLKEREKLEELSGLSAEEAKKRLVDSLKDEAKSDAQSYINEIMDEAKLTANKEAKRIVIQSINIYAADQFGIGIKDVNCRENLADRLFGAEMRIFVKIVQQPLRQYQRRSRGLHLLNAESGIHRFNKVFQQHG